MQYSHTHVGTSSMLKELYTVTCVSSDGADVLAFYAVIRAMSCHLGTTVSCWYALFCFVRIMHCKVLIALYSFLCVIH